MVGKSLSSQIFKHVNLDCATSFNGATGILPSAKEFSSGISQCKRWVMGKHDTAPRHSLFSAISEKTLKKTTDQRCSKISLLLPEMTVV